MNVQIDRATELANELDDALEGYLMNVSFEADEIAAALRIVADRWSALHDN